MICPTTTLEAAATWCLEGQLQRPVRPPDDSLTIQAAETLPAELDVAARQYRQAIAEGADTVYFAVRDRRAPRERIITGLRDRGVDLPQTAGVAPEHDPIVVELLQVTNALLDTETDGTVSESTRTTLAASLDPEHDIDAVLANVTAAETLPEALDQWVAATDLIDRLVRADDGLHHQGHPQGTVRQRASASHLEEIHDVARYLDSLRDAGLSLPGIGPRALSAAIEESMMDDRHPLLPTQAAGQQATVTSELVEMAELKLNGSADVVIVLEATEQLLDANPGDRLFTLNPAFGEHPDTPGVTAVTTEQAEQTFGSLPHISDPIAAWFVGLGRRHLGNALAAAKTRAVICTRVGPDTNPARTVTELRENLDVPMTTLDNEPIAAAEGFDGPTQSDTDSVQRRIDRLAAHLDPEVSAPRDDDATTVVDHLQTDIRDGKLIDEQLGTVLELLAAHRTRPDDVDSTDQ